MGAPMSGQRWIKLVSVVVTVIALLLFFCYAIYPLPMRIRVPFLLFSIIVLLPLAHFLRVVLPRYMSKRLHKAVGIDEQEWEQAPDRYFFLRRQLKILRSLAKREITSVEVTSGNGVKASSQNPSVVSTFSKFLSGTLVFTLDHAVEQLSIRIRVEKDDLSYEAFVPAGNRGDLILKFRESGDYGGIRLPGLKRWLDRNFLNKER